jgi:HlyD family secretion protein
VATGKGGAVGRQLRTLFDVGAIRELTDGQLLERFATGRGEGSELAFAALVERHGPMVLRVARGVLDDPNDAQDAFQATFLVLVAKAGGLWVRDSLGPWLHQVAYRTATCLKANLARRRRLERRAAILEEAAPASRPDADLARVLLEEVERLPERYRAPLILCDLEGRTHEQAARALGWPVGTVKSRQARARQRLRDRLTRRGVAPGLANLVPWPAVAPTIPASLIDGVTVAAARFVGSRAIVPGTAAALAREVIRSMIILRWTKTATVFLALGVASGTGLIAQDRGDKPGEAPKAQAQAQAQAAPVDDPTVVEVKPGKLRQVISERGNLEASSTRDLLCEVEGGTTIISIKPEGTTVKAGEVVVELDSASLRDTLENQRITTGQAEAAYKQARLVREVAEYAVKEYTKSLLKQERAALSGKIALTRSEIDKNQGRLEKARAARKRLDEAGARRTGGETAADIAAELAVDDHVVIADLAVQRAKFELGSAEAELKRLNESAGARITWTLERDVKKAEADELSKLSSLGLERTKEHKIERQIQRCTLTAPIDGLLVYANDPGGPNRARVLIEEGATVRERQKLVSVIDLSAPLRLKTYVHESIIDRLANGNPVKITVDAAANEVLDGEVAAIPPMADPTSFFRNGAKSYSTRIVFKDFPAKFNLRPGMSARAEILVGEHENVLQVPYSSVFGSPGMEHLFVAVKPPGGAPEWREVTLGAADYHGSVEVEAGLKPGERVVREPSAEKGLDMTGKKLVFQKTAANPF